MQDEAAAPTRVFSIPELVESIVENTYTRHFMDEAAPVHRGKKTLFMLTQVDKTISKVACSKLWKSMVSFKPLIDLLPPDLISDGVDADDIASLRVPLRRPVQEELNRYLDYSCLVRIFFPSGDSQIQVARFEAVLAVVRELELKEHHFSQLRELVVGSDVDDWSSFLSIVGSPDLQSFKIDYRERDSLAHHMQSLKDMGHLFPNLKSWAFAGACLSAGMIEGLIRTAWVGLNLLSELHIFGTSCDAVFELFSHLHLLRVLRVLRLAISDPDVTSNIEWDQSGELPTSPDALELSNFELHCTHAGHFFDILRISFALSISFLQMRCEVIVPTSSPNLEIIMPHLVQTCPDLETLSWFEPILAFSTHSFPMNLFEQAQLWVDCSALIHMDGMANLKCIDFTFLGGVAASLELLDAIADGCPLLEQCALSPATRIPSSKPEEVDWVVTLKDVVIFAGKCPKLSTLGILFDGRKPQDETEEELKGSNVLTQLNIGASSIDDVDYVASMLKRAFPNLESIGGETLGLCDIPEYLIQTHEELHMWIEVRDRFGWLDKELYDAQMQLAGLLSKEGADKEEVKKLTDRVLEMERERGWYESSSEESD